MPAGTPGGLPPLRHGRGSRTKVSAGQLLVGVIGSCILLWLLVSSMLFGGSSSSPSSGTSGASSGTSFHHHAGDSLPPGGPRQSSGLGSFLSASGEKTPQRAGSKYRDGMPVIASAFLKPREVGVGGSKLALRADVFHPTCKRYLAELHEKQRAHRKAWEFCYIMAEIDRAGLLVKGKRGLGFAVGTEPLASAMAARGADVVISDLPIDSITSKAWDATAQHAATLDAAHKPEILTAEEFSARASFRAVDMNVIPYDLLNGTFDFTWSSSSLEHVGSCKRAQRFIRKSLHTVRPGGLVVHTTELVLSSLTMGRDVPGLCLFTKTRMEETIRDLKADGHAVLAVKWGVGADSRTEYDVKPFDFENHMALLDAESNLVHTSVMLVVRRAASRNSPKLEFVPVAPVPWHMRLRVPKAVDGENEHDPAVRPDDADLDLSIFPSYIAADGNGPARTTLQAPRSRLAHRLDLETKACIDQLAELGEKPLPFHHRKQWEFCVMAHNLKSLGVVGKGKRGLGYAVGHEPLASWFVKEGADVVVSDMPKSGAYAGAWNSTSQHAGELMSTWKEGIVSKELYSKHASFTPVDMNHLPSELMQGEFDFTWSSSSLEHVGTCQLGIEYFVNAMAALRPGGIALHTTELLISHEDAAADNPHLCFFSKTMFDELAEDLAAEGHELVGGPIDFTVGVRGARDFDSAPFTLSREHIALSDVGHVHTSILVIARRGGAGSRKPDAELTQEQLGRRQARIARALPNATKAAAVDAAIRLPAQHVGLRDFAPSSMLAHTGDFSNPLLRRMLAQMGEPIAHCHRRQWELAAITFALEQRGLLLPGNVGFGVYAGEDGMTTYMASKGAHLAILTPEPVNVYRPNIGIAKSDVAPRVHVELSPQSPLEVLTELESQKRFDFVYSVTATSTFKDCQSMLNFIHGCASKVRPGGTAAFALTVSILGAGSNGPDRCELTYGALRQFAMDMKGLGFNTTVPSPAVGWVTDVDDVDKPPFSAVDHMVYAHAAQLWTSAVIVIDRRADE